MRLMVLFGIIVLGWAFEPVDTLNMFRDPTEQREKQQEQRNRTCDCINCTKH